MNLSLITLEMLIVFISILVLYKHYKKEGLYLWILIASLLANILTYKTISIFSFQSSSGLILYVSIYLASNLLVQKHGKDEIRRVLTMLAISLTTFYAFIFILGTFNSFYIKNDELISLPFINLTLRGTLSYITILLFSLLIETNLYYYIRKTKNKIWLSNTLSLIVTCLFDSVLLTIFVFLNVVDTNELLTIMLTSYIIKVIIGCLGTQVIYLGIKINEYKK